MTSRAALLALLALGACAAPAASPPIAQAPSEPAPASAPAAPRSAAAVAGPDDDEVRLRAAQVEQMLARVAEIRGLPIKHPVNSRVLARGEIVGRIRAHVDKELPPDVLTYQGEVLAALELIPVDYDFTAGMYRLLEGRIAGFYEPDDATMYLVDDLDDGEATETLAHELVHALQDQSYSLGTLLDFVPGDSDRLGAVHALVEGDATSAMLDIVAGSAFAIDEALLRKLVAMSTALSSVGDTPRALQESLGAPYTDGFALVQHLRRSGGWPAVDAAWRALPESTEQLLHPEKLAAREPPIHVPPPPVAALGAGFRVVLDDVMGEQGLRITFGEYGHRDAATAAAAGWGGDRFVVARRDDPAAPARREYAVAWKLRFDTPADAREAARLLAARFGKACRERSALGPMAWSLADRDVSLVAGPFERRGTAAKSTGTCADAKVWLDSVVKAPIGAP